MCPTHTELLFTVKLFYNLSLPLPIQPHSLVLYVLVGTSLVVLCAWWYSMMVRG